MPALPTPRTMLPATGLALLALAVLAAAFLAAPVASAATVNYKGSSADGKVVFFETEEQLVPGDTDTKRDVYERSFDEGVGAYVTREVSLGPAGGTDAYPALFEKASADGTKVFFSTEESMVETDTDHKMDVYMRDLETGTTTLVSQGEPGCAPACGNGASDAGFAAASADGTKVFFVSEEELTSEDTDASVDVYVRDLTTETTKLVSAGGASCAPACGNGAFGASLRAISADASHAYFTTAESLSGADTDSAVDVYSRNLVNGTTSLVSEGGVGCVPACGNSGAVPVFQGSSEDGSRVFFTTDEQLVGGDEDTATDIYARDLPAGPTFLISGGKAGTATASFAAASGDGAHAFFTTAEPLVAEDEDEANDVYEWSGGKPSLVSSATCASECGSTFDAVSADSETVVFSTAEQLSGEDTDNRVDIYEQEVGGGSPVLVSREAAGCGGCGNGAADARFNRASADASHVVFTSSEVLSPEDGDSEDDIYARDVPEEETSLITTSPSFCPLKKGNCGATYVDASVDGRHVFFTSIERFTLDDGDNEVDVYERDLGESPGEEVTRLVSTGNSPDLELGPAPPQLKGTNPASPAASTKPKILGQAEAGSSIKLYTTSNCSGEPVAIGNAAQLAEPGIGVTVPTGQTTKFRATAEAEGFISLCSNPVSYTQQNEAEGGSGGGAGGGGIGGGSGGGGGGFGLGGGKGGSGTGVSYVTPHTRITFAPASKTRTRNPVFRFTDATGQPGTRFRCKVDRKHWKRCGSPLRLKRLNRGKHVLRVLAVNAIGVPEPAPATRRFKVVSR